MADYYPLLSRAIASLGDQPGISHQAIYDRARDALGRQLRGFEPPLSEDHIAAELAALEETIARVEREHAAGKAVEDELFAIPRDAHRPGAELPGDEGPASDAPTPEAPTPKDLGKPDIAAGAEPDDRRDGAPLSEAGDIAPGENEALRPQRPRLPSRSEDQRSRRPVALFAALAVVAMLVTGLIALTRRDQPAPAQPPAVATATPDAAAPEGAKTEGRLGGGTEAASRPAPAPAPQQPATPPQASAAQPAETPAPQAVPVTGGRAFMVLEAQGTAPNQFEGRVTWSFAPDPGIGGAKALRAAIDFQSAGLSVDFSIARNTDATLNASHTVMVIFDTKGSGNTVREMSAVEWRERENQTGVTLAGIVVPVQDNIFMLGLDRSEAALARNLGLLQSQKWMVFEMRLSNGRRGAILVEKGMNGEKAVNDALAEWK